MQLKKYYKKTKILTFCTHERYQSNMNDISAEFYLLQYNGSKPWKTQYAALPDNHFFLPNNIIPQYLDFDFILCQSKWQFEIAHKLSKERNLPLVCLEHTIPTSNFSSQELKALKSMRGHYNVYISDYNKNMWEDGNGFIIKHCVDTDIFSFKPNSQHLNNVFLAVQNDYINRNYCLNFDLFRELAQHFPVYPVGDTAGLSESAKDVKDLVQKYQACKIYINTAHESPIPTSLLEAMSCGCACLSVNSCAIPEYINHGYNGFLFDNVEEMLKYANMLYNDAKLRESFGQAARQTIEVLCDKNYFTDSWNKFIKGVVCVQDLQ